MGRSSSLWLVSWLVPILPLSSWHMELDKCHISLSQSHSKENIEALCSPRPLELELPQCLMLLTDSMVLEVYLDTLLPMLSMLPLSYLMPQLFMLPLSFRMPLFFPMPLLFMLLMILLRYLLTATTMLLLMTTLEQLSTRLRPMMELGLLRDPTLSTFLTDESSMSTIMPMTMMVSFLKLAMSGLLLTLRLLLMDLL